MNKHKVRTGQNLPKQPSSTLTKPHLTPEEELVKKLVDWLFAFILNYKPSTKKELEIPAKELNDIVSASYFARQKELEGEIERLNEKNRDLRNENSMLYTDESLAQAVQQERERILNDSRLRLCLHDLRSYDPEDFDGADLMKSVQNLLFAFQVLNDTSERSNT